jgi:hypothetical protein
MCSMTPKAYAFYMAYVYGTYPLDMSQVLTLLSILVQKYILTPVEEMSQYENLFSSTRIPRKGKDELKKFSATRHMVVQRGADFWKVQAISGCGLQLLVHEALSY